MKRRGLFAVVIAVLALASGPCALACSACFGKSDSTMARSLNASIFTLMGFIGTVLIGAASFFVFLARRAAANAPAAPATNSSSQPQS